MNGPSLALDESGNLHAVWSTAGAVKAAPRLKAPLESPFKVMYRRFDARKRAWDAPVCLATGRHPRVAVSPDGVPLVTWSNDGILVAQLTDGGRGTPPSLRVSAPMARPAPDRRPRAATGRSDAPGRSVRGALA